jgi:hypothetical protein
MPVPVMNIGHVIVLMFFCGVFMLMRMCFSSRGVMRVSGVIVPVAVLVKYGRMNVRMSMNLIDQQERADDH